MAQGGNGVRTNEKVNRALYFDLHYGYNEDGSLWTRFDISGGTTYGNSEWHRRGPLGHRGNLSRSVVEAIDPVGLVSATHLRRG